MGASNPAFVLATGNLAIPISLLLALQYLGAHLEETVLGLALGEIGNGLRGAVDVFLGHGASLLDAIALNDKGASLRE